MGLSGAAVFWPWGHGVSLLLPFGPVILMLLVPSLVIFVIAHDGGMAVMAMMAVMARVSQSLSTPFKRNNAAVNLLSFSTVLINLTTKVQVVNPIEIGML